MARRKLILVGSVCGSGRPNLRPRKCSFVYPILRGAGEIVCISQVSRYKKCATLFKCKPIHQTMVSGWACGFDGKQHCDFLRSQKAYIMQQTAVSAAALNQSMHAFKYGRGSKLLSLWRAKVWLISIIYTFFMHPFIFLHVKRRPRWANTGTLVLVC